MQGKTRATTENLYHMGGKVELVNGEMVCMSQTGGGRPSRASLEEGHGHAYHDCLPSF